MVDGVAASVDMEFSAKARPLPPLRPKHLAEPSLTNTTTRMSRPDDVAVTAAVQETKAGLPSPVAKEGPQEASVPRSPTSTANEVPEPATATATTDEPKAGPSSTIGGPLAAAVAGDSLPATDIRALPAAAVVVAAAVVSPRASGVGEEEVFGTNPREEPREPSAGVPAEAAEKVEMASGKVDRAVASNSAEAATSELSDEDEPFAALAAASDEARVESSRGAGGVSPVTAGGAGEREQPASTTGTAVDKTASAPVPGGAVITPTSLGNKVSTEVTIDSTQKRLISVGLARRMTQAAMVSNEIVTAFSYVKLILENGAPSSSVRCFFPGGYTSIWFCAVFGIIWHRTHFNQRGCVEEK